MREAFDVAAGLLARREHSVQQLRCKLAKRDFDEQAIALALEACQRSNLQSDVRFSEGTCRSRIARGYGPFMIKQLLEHEGISTEIIEQVFADVEHEVDWVALAHAVWMKKYHSNSRGLTAGPSDMARQKQRQFLRYRGFTDATVRALFKTLEAAFDD